jgi:hypothetical protein
MQDVRSVQVRGRSKGISGITVYQNALFSVCGIYDVTRGSFSPRVSKFVNGILRRRTVTVFIGIFSNGSVEISNGPKKARPDDWDDPYDDPLGDALLPLLLLAAGYAICSWRKNKSHSRLATPESK